MFAPWVRQAQTTAAGSPSKNVVQQHRPPVVAQRPQHRAVDLVLMHQNMSGSEAATRLLTQRIRSLNGNEPRHHFERETEGLPRVARVAPSWDLGNIALFPPDYSHRLESRSVQVSRPSDSFELYADLVAARFLAGVTRAASDDPRPGLGMAVHEPRDSEALREMNAPVDCARQGATRPAALGSLPQSKGPLANCLAGRYGEGQRLDETVRRSAEPLLGHDLAAVRIHPHEADDMAEAVDARAFTVGRHIYFRRGNYNPGTRDGMAVLLHELVHTTQPGGETIQRMARIGSWEFHTHGSKAVDNCAPGLVDIPFRLGVDTKHYGPGSFTNGMELRANIAGHEAGTTYDIKRVMQYTAWEKVGGQWIIGDQSPPGVDDDPDNLDECLTPSAPPMHIYSADAPGLADVKFADPSGTEIVVKHTFFEWVDMEKPLGVGAESTNVFEWHSIIWLTKRGGAWTMDKTRSEIAKGRINVDTPVP